jgi:hypothetical protein
MTTTFANFTSAADRKRGVSVYRRVGASACRRVGVRTRTRKSPLRSRLEIVNKIPSKYLTDQLRCLDLGAVSRGCLNVAEPKGRTGVSACSVAGWEQRMSSLGQQRSSRSLVVADLGSRSDSPINANLSRSKRSVPALRLCKCAQNRDGAPTF